MRPSPALSSRLPIALRRLAALSMGALLALTAGPGRAAAAPCGTVVVPVGLGQGGGADITSLNPLLILSGYNHAAEDLLYRPLVMLNSKVQADPDLSLARTIGHDITGRIWTITLKDYRWSDGAPVTAADVVYCFDLIRKLGHTYNSYGTGGMPEAFDSVTATDAHTLRIVLNKTINPDLFVTTGLSQLYAFPRHDWERMAPGGDIGEMWRRQTDPTFFHVVDGPFRIARFTLGRALVLDANPLYGGRKPSIARLSLSFLDNNNQLAAYTSGAIDAVNLPFSIYDIARSLPDTRIVRIAPPYDYLFMSVNFANPATAFFRDVRVRQAMQDAINQQEIVRLVFHGDGAPAYAPVPPLPDTYLSPRARGGQIPVGYDPARARALLDAAGWRPGVDGIRQKDGHRLELTVLLPAGGGVETPIVEIIERNYHAIGIALHIKQMQFNQMLAAIAGPPKGWEAYSMLWNFAGMPEGMSSFHTGGSDNLMHYSDPEMDRLTENTVTDQTLNTLFAFEDYATEQQPLLVLPSSGYTLLAHPGVEGWEHFNTSTGDWLPENLRITDPARCRADRAS